MTSQSEESTDDTLAVLICTGVDAPQGCSIAALGRGDLSAIVSGTDYQVAQLPTRFKDDVCASSLDFTLQRGNWLPIGLRRRELAWGSRLHRPVLSPFPRLARDHTGDTIKIWLKPVH